MASTKIVQHYSNEIDGFFDFEDIYREMVRQAANEAHFVEVGSWLGKSTSYLAVEAANSGKAICIDAVDTWCGARDNSRQREFAKKYDVMEKCRKNVARSGYEVSLIRNESVLAAQQYPDNSLDFVFIDACHAFPDVMLDILAWQPKVKFGGYLGGHDYRGGPWYEVGRSVRMTLPAHQIQARGHSWLWHKPLLVNVVTAVSRMENLRAIQENIRDTFKTCTVRWICVIDAARDRRLPSNVVPDCVEQTASENSAGGVQKARGLQLCQPGWVYVLDDDNLFAHGFEDAFLEALNEHPTAEAFVFGQHHNKGVRRGRRTEFRLGGIDQAQFIVRHDVAMFGEYAYKKHCSDWYYIERIWKAGRRVVFIDKVITLYNAMRI